MDIIRRVATLDRASVKREATEDDGEKLTFSGHAAVFDQPTLIGSRDWGFVEWIEPGAFASVLDDDVRFLFNHDGLPLARTTNGTLKLEEDEQGLVSEADLAPVTLSRDISTLVKRGDLTQMSFAFYPGQMRSGKVNLKDREGSGIGDVEISDELDGMPYMAITSMERLFDVSVVTYPAYDGTDADMNSLRRSAEYMTRTLEKIRGIVAPKPCYDARLAHEKTRARMIRS